MKKLVIPVLAAIVSLTSCSKALYKDKYDWVKVERVETKIATDTFSVVSSSLQEFQSTAEVESNATSEDNQTETEIGNAIVSDSTPRDSLKTKETKNSGQKAEKKQTKMAQSGYLTINARPNFSVGSSNLSREEKGYIAGGIGILLLLILMAAFGPGQFVSAILFVYFLAKLIGTAVAIVLVLGGIYLLFQGFITMMDH